MAPSYEGISGRSCLRVVRHCEGPGVAPRPDTLHPEVRFHGNKERTPELFGAVQKPKERIGALVIATWGLFHRLAPEASEEERASVIQELLALDIRAYSRGRRFTGLDDLLEFGGQMERDITELRKAASAKQSEPNKRTEDQGRRAAAPPSRSGGNQPAARTTREPYPCRWCDSKDHFDNRCSSKSTAHTAPKPAPRIAPPDTKTASSHQTHTPTLQKLRRETRAKAFARARRQ